MIKNNISFITYSIFFYLCCSFKAIEMNNPVTNAIEQLLSDPSTFDAMLLGSAPCEDTICSLLRDKLPPSVSPAIKAKIKRKSVHLKIESMGIICLILAQHVSSMESNPAESIILKLQDDYSKLKCLISGTRHEGLFLIILSDIEFQANADLSNLGRDYPSYQLFMDISKWTRITRPLKIFDFNQLSKNSLTGFKEYESFTYHIWVLVLSIQEAKDLISRPINFRMQ